ncbi:hypothetical protein [Aureibacillus halotolerans]|uniref:Uncharacterized protein n=1 Tax=Aureibacillus halotolerans TaxID=1508390 RepID=A0A4R6UA15_9BACI|nr:hypothetical protein [Aureibacillus halotolerans]TDQ42672.1 hypothetical protein EV213_101101 [Aureibacillus halotolerans]
MDSMQFLKIQQVVSDIAIQGATVLLMMFSAGMIVGLLLRPLTMPHFVKNLLTGIAILGGLFLWSQIPLKF